MRVEVDRQADFFLKRLDQLLGRTGFDQARHVLEAQNMGTCGFKLFGHRDVVFQVVFGAVGVLDVTGVANRAFAHLIGGDHRIHRDAHVFDPVEAVEYAEDINAGLSRLFHKALDDVVRVIGVAHTVGGAQKHLCHDVWHRLTNVAQALPRTFLQEPVGHVKRRTAPTFHRQQLRQFAGVGRCAADHVDGPHPRRKQRLVAIAHRGVCQQKLRLGLHPIRHSLRALGV